MKDVLLLAGGVGSRLASVSQGLPKPLIDVGGRPFIEYVLDQAIESGYERIIVAVSYKWQMLHDRIGKQYRRCPVYWSVEQQPLGTGGAIRHAFQQFEVEEALVLNADTLFRIDLRDFALRHQAAGANVSVALRRVSNVARFGDVVVDHSNRIVSFREKGNIGQGWINGGVYAIRGDAWHKGKPNAFSFERDYLQIGDPLQALFGFPMDGYFIDIGIPEDLKRARRELSL